MRRRHLILGSLALVVAPARPARAAAVVARDAQKFAAAQEAGQGIVVHVHAPW